MLDSVLQEEHLRQASAHLRGRCVQSLVHFQLPVRRQIPSGHRGRRGEEDLTDVPLDACQTSSGTSVGPFLRSSTCSESCWRPAAAAAAAAGKADGARRSCG